MTHTSPRIRKRFLAVSLASLAIALVAPSPVAAQDAQAEETVAGPDFAHDASDLEHDPRAIYGTLPNGLRYAVMRNSTPSEVAAIRMRIDTGSWNETEEQRGIAHFLEHMAFNGSKNVPEGEMIKRLERHGLAFGADTNASTGFDQTVYKLNLPTVDEAVIDEALFLMRETASNLTLDAEAIDRERGVIASEKSARDSVSFRSLIDNIGFFTEGSGRIDRLPIGADETIATMPRSEFVRYYQDFYRPENTFIVFVGDIDPQVAIAKIEQNFADWQPSSPAGTARDLIPATDEKGRIGYYRDPEVLTFTTLATLYPYEVETDSAERRRASLLRGLGNRIVNRRLSRMVDENQAPFLSATLGRYAQREIIDGALIRMRSDPAKWQESLAAGDLEVRRALEFGFSQAELDEQIALYRRSLEVAVERANTRKTYAQREFNYVDALVDAFGDERVFTSPEVDLQLFEDAVKGLTVEQVEQAFRTAWAGYAEPTIYLSTSLEIDNPEEEITSALAAARQVAASAPEERELAPFGYTGFGAPGRVIEEHEVEAAGAQLIRFDNNVRLNFKHTEFDTGTVYIKLRVGGGFFSMPRKDEGLRRLALNLLLRSGVEGHTSEDLRSLFAGKRVGARPSLRIDSDAFEFLSATDRTDLGEQMNLLAAYLTAPAYRDEVADQYRDSMRAWYPTHDGDPSSVASKEIPRIVRSGDGRYGYSDLESFLAPGVDEVRRWVDPELKQGAIEITVVGDIDRETVITEVARTLGALPLRPDPVEANGDARKLAFPERPAEPIRLYHAGNDDQGLVRIYWDAPEAADRIDRYRLTVLRAILRNRMTAVLREELGSTYSPGVGLEGNDEIPGYGYIFANVTIVPEDADKVLVETEKVGRSLVDKPVDEDEFQRAIKPILEDLPSSLENNAYWIDVLDDAQSDGDGLASYALRKATFEAMTVEDVNRIAREVFTRDKVIPIVILPKGLQPE